MKKKAKFNIFLWLSLVFVLILAIFFLVPNIFGDRMVSQPPAEYLPLVLDSAQKYDMDPFLIMGLCMQESGWNPRAVSSANAHGLTQIVPSTASGIAKMIGKPSYDLYNPADSIDMGAAYLKSLTDRYNGNVYAALAAYNMGTGNVDPGFRMGMDFTDNRYAQGVSSYTRIYKELYPGIFDNVAVASVDLGTGTSSGGTSGTASSGGGSSATSTTAVSKKAPEEYKIKFEEVARTNEGETSLYSSIWKAYFGKLFGLFGANK